MTTDQLRRLYLDYFKSKSHRVFPSDSLIPANDPSVLFTGAGMNQFKPYFLGLKKDVRKAASCQKCLRTADLDRVGKTAAHHTFFEMLGNFSFGDYFKEEAISWGWEFVTKELGLPKERLWVSVYEEDDEAFEIWKRKVGLPESRIRRMDAHDNFWPANAPAEGPNGPCGPCSEIYVGETPGKGVEIWNLVFTQFDRQSDGSLKALPQKNIDTGMGLERTAAVMQGVESNFDIDSFQRIRQELKSLLKSGSSHTAHENAAMDHARAVVFSIADGVNPSNTGRGYVVRKLIRLGSEHITQAGGLEPGQFWRLVPSVVRVMKEEYPELAAKEKGIASVVENEERSYTEILKTQVPRLLNDLKEAKKMSTPVSTWVASIAFPYYDTYGVPIDKIVNTCEIAGLSFQRSVFDELLNEQKKRSREGSKIAGEIFSKAGFYALIEGLPPTEFLGYEATEIASAKLLRILKNQEVVLRLDLGEEGVLIFDKSPFYAEAGGQIGDTGIVEGVGVKAKVLDTQWFDRCIVHQVSVGQGVLAAGEAYTLTVDAERRADIMKNHTATHLLHSALRKVLGDHVKQSGSLVAPDRLRFDFTHFGSVDPKKLSEVEALVNSQIEKDIPLEKRVMDKDEAMKEGAIAFFGEKYGDAVRVVSIGDFSKELCGGTHLGSTGETGSFKIISEGSIQAGVRRIEAVTGRTVTELIDKSEKELAEIVREFGLRGPNFNEELQRYQKKFKDLKTKLFNLANLKMKQETQKEFENARGINGIKSFYMPVSAADIELIKRAVQFLKSQKKSFVGLFRADSSDKFNYVVAASGDVVAGGWDSNQVIQILNQKLGGNGGGRPDFAVGGSKNLEFKTEVFEIFKAGTDNLIRSIKINQ